MVTGKIEPRNEVDIKPQINGIISEIYKEAGEQVEENEVIAKLKVIPDMSSLSSAESRVRLADINLNQAQTDYEREKLLYDKDLVSAEEYDQVLQALNQAKEEGPPRRRRWKSSAMESPRPTRPKVRRSCVPPSRASFSTCRWKVGNSVIQANTMNDGTTVATVADMSDLIFDGNIDETEVGSLREGMPMLISVGALWVASSSATLEYIARKPSRRTGQPVRDKGGGGCERGLCDALRLQRERRDRAAGGSAGGFRTRERAGVRG